MRFLALFPMLVAAPAAAQTLTASEADILPRLIDSLCVDIHPSNGCEQVVLLESGEPDTADLVILTDRRTDPAGDPVLVARSFTFNGTMWGMSPSLQDVGNRQVNVQSEQTGIGRHPWFQDLRIGWQDDGFVLLAYSYSSYDRFTASGFSCEVDYVAGQFRTEIAINDPETEVETIEADSGATDPEPIPLTDWHAFAPMPEICTQAWNHYFTLVP